VENSLRIDKWLWAVRLYKTRSLAAEECRSGKIKINELAVKPSREIKSGDILQMKQGPITKTVRVVSFPPNRVSAKLVINFMEDLTSPEEYQKLQLMKDGGFVKRERGAGRPTKRDRRDIEEFFPEW
jgi:ribosome-associated heat shock protein Hsp15